MSHIDPITTPASRHARRAFALKDANVDYSWGLTHAMADMARISSDMLALPFDMAREQYAKSVRAGLVERSLIASSRFGHMLRALERFALGGMARRY